jgi:hypothetical protein
VGRNGVGHIHLQKDGFLEYLFNGGMAKMESGMA